MKPNKNEKGGTMKKRYHPAVKDLKNDYDKGKLSRREFIRYATLLGVSAMGAAQIAGVSLFSKPAYAAGVKRGGTLRIAGPVAKMTHPAQFSWVTPSNQYCSCSPGESTLYKSL